MFKKHVGGHSAVDNLPTEQVESALAAYLDTRRDDAEDKNLLEEAVVNHRKSISAEAEPSSHKDPQGDDSVPMHLGAMEAMMRKVDSNKLLTFELAKNGSDLIRVLANRLSNRVQGGLSLDERLDIAQQMHTMAHILEALYKELKDTDLRVLQTKARRWDTVAKAVADSLSEATRTE